MTLLLGCINRLEKLSSTTELTANTALPLNQVLESHALKRGFTVVPSTETPSNSSSKLKHCDFFLLGRGSLVVSPFRPVQNRYLKIISIMHMASNDSQPSFDFVKSVTKSGSKSSSSSVGLWLSLFSSILLCLLAVLLSMYVAVVGVVIAALAVSHARDLSKRSSKNKSIYLISIIIFALCFLLLIFSAVISGLSR